MHHPIPQAVIDKVWDSIVMGPNNCWISTYSTSGTTYPRVHHWVNRSTGKKVGYLAHRVMYTAVNGPIPDDMVVDHTCFNRRCVNPDHLRLLSRVDNSTISIKNHPTDPFNFCVNGHDLRVVGVYKNPKRPNGRGSCRKCIRDRQRGYVRPSRRKS